MAKVTQFNFAPQFDAQYNELYFTEAGRVKMLTNDEIDFEFAFGQSQWVSDHNNNEYCDIVADVACLSECGTHHFDTIIENFSNLATDCTTEYIEQAATEAATARKSFLSSVMSNAWSKVRKTDTTIANALRESWSDARIVAMTIVNFIKVADFNKENPPIQTRTVHFLQLLEDGRFLFREIIHGIPAGHVSFHKYQLV